MTKLFSNELVNTGRQVELDLAKCLAIFFMIFLHRYSGLCGDGVHSGWRAKETETVRKAKGNLSYRIVSAKKGKKSFKKKISIDTQTGKVTVKKGLKKGTANYKTSAWKTIKFKVRVK